MSNLKRALISSVFFLITGCFLYNGGTHVYFYIERPPRLQIDKREKIALLPILLEKYESGLQEYRITEFFYKAISSNGAGFRFFYNRLVFDKLQKKAITIIKKGKVKKIEGYEQKIRYFVTGKIFFEKEFYSSYGNGDILNPAFSVDRNSPPGIWESDTHWRRRSFSDILYVARLKIFVYDGFKNEVIYKGVIKSKIILKDYNEDFSIHENEANIKRELVLSLGEEFVRLLLPVKEKNERIFLK